MIKHLKKYGNVWKVRYAIPPDVRHAFPEVGRAGEKVISLRTGDDAEAVRLGKPLIDDIERRIAEARQPVAAPLAAVHKAFTPDEVSNAITRWKTRTLTEAKNAAFNGLTAAINPWGEEAVALADFRYNLDEPIRWPLIPEFSARMADALRSEGLEVADDHPLLDQKTPRGWFGMAWRDVERRLESFRFGNLDWEPEPLTQPQPVTVAAPAALPAPTSGVTLKPLLEEFLTSQQAKSEDDIRLHWRRLVEHLGDVDAASVTPKQLNAFLVQLRRFPKTRRPEIEAKTFPEIMAQHANEGLPLLAPITVWKYFTTYQQVFGWAARVREIPFNPVEGAMPTKPKPEKKVLPYEKEQIADMFAKPMFVGCSKTHDSKGNLWGYRDQPGDLLLKDGRYWMPILNLYHGNRMEEWGGAKVADIKVLSEGDSEIDYLDLYGRSLKNPQANRWMPIHPKMRELGFFDYVDARRRAKDEYLFPEFPHDVSEAEDPLASTRLFTKWWGLWSDANGFPDPSVNFHSFRHSFIRACRGKIDPEIRGLITGHKGRVNEGSNYGDGAELKVLADAIAKVAFPTFPRLP